MKLSNTTFVSFIKRLVVGTLAFIISYIGLILLLTIMITIQKSSDPNGDSNSVGYLGLFLLGVQVALPIAGIVTALLISKIFPYQKYNRLLSILQMVIIPLLAVIAFYVLVPLF